MDRQPHQIQHDASPQSLHQAAATQLSAEVALESNIANKLVLKRDSIDFSSYQNHTPIKVTTTQQTKAPTPITAQVETSPSLDDLDYYGPAPAIQLALASAGGGANTTPTTPNAIDYCGQQHHVSTATSQSDYYSSPEAVESPLTAGSLINGCSGGGTQMRASWPSSVLQTAAHQMASAAAAAAVAAAGSQSPQLMAQSSQTNHLAALGQSSQQHNQFQNQVNSQYASLHHHSQVQAHHQHAQQQVSPAGRSISPYQASYGTSPALANGYAPGHHHHHPHQHHQHQLQQQHHQPSHQPLPLPPPPPQPMSLEAHQYGEAAQAMVNRLPQTKHTHHHHTVQHHQPNHQHTSQHHHNLPQHHHQIQPHPYTNMPPAHSNSHHQLGQINQHNHEQHYGNNHQQSHYMSHHHHNHPHQAAHLSSPPSVAIGPPDQPHEPIYPVQHMQQQHAIQHLTPGGYYQSKSQSHHQPNQSQPQQQHHHQNHYQQYQNSQQLFRSSTMLTPPRVEPISLRASQMATPPRLDSGNNLIRANSIATSPRSDNNIDRSSSKKAESPLNQLHLQCANLLDEHQQQQQRISNILLKDGIDLSANNDNNISTTATTTTTPTNVAGANAPLAATATTSAKTSTTSTTSTTSNGDSNLNNDNNISTTAATTTTTGNSNNNANNSNGNNNNNNSGRSKRLRTSFKHNQLKEMKRYFATNQNPDANNLKTLAQTTGLSKRVLQVWFQNARAKHRRNTARLASQQLFNVVNQHTMLPRHHHQQDHLQTYQHHDTQHHQQIN